MNKYLTPQTIFFTLGTLVALIACNQLGDKAATSMIALDRNDTLRYQFQTIEKVSGDCLSPQTNNCITAQLKYPYFADSTPAAHSINRFVSNHLHEAFFDVTSINDTLNNFATLSEKFIAQYQAFIKQSPKFATPWSFYIGTQVVLNTPQVLSLAFAQNSYTGGAHPSSYFRNISFDATNGRRLTITDLVTDTTYLYTLAEKKFRQLYNLDPAQNLAELGYFIYQPNNQFVLPANFLLSPTSLKFQYNPYEIGAYAIGSPEIEIQYAEIPDILSPLYFPDRQLAYH